MLALADGVSITIGNNVWNFGLDILLFILIAAIVGVVAEFIVGWKMPLGVLGATIAGVIGIWLMTRVIVIQGIGDVNIWGVPLFRALIGAIIFVAIWHLLARGTTRRRYRSA